MHDLTQFTLRDMTECGTALRSLTYGAKNLETLADRTVRYLYDHLVDSETGARSCVLVRFFKTSVYSQLEERHRIRIAESLDLPLPDAQTMCFKLLATAGVEPQWNDSRLSKGHQICPLDGPDIAGRFPMFAQLIQQFGLSLEAVSQPDPLLLVDLEHATFNVFHVPEAVGNPHVPAQDDFVIPYGVRSVLGFGGMLPSGNLYAIILFSTVHIPRETADYFKTLALNVKMAMLPFDESIASSIEPEDLAPASPEQPHPPVSDTEIVRLRSHVASLEQLLGVHEHVVLEQSDRIARALAEVSREATRADALSRVASRLNANLRLETVLDAVCEESMRALDVPAALVQLHSEEWFEPEHAVCRGLPAYLAGQFRPIPQAFSDDSEQQDSRITIISDVQALPNLPDLPNAHLISALDIRTMVSISLTRQAHLVGTLFVFSLGRPLSFSADKISLLQGLADQAVQAINNAQLHVQAERAAVLAERNRLAHDLHDSVTQSLYSLTLFAEAGLRLAQAGDTERVLNYLARLGATAQQALKEMRLLVYELRPLALEQSGLAGALQERLDAVEGRAGVTARLLTGDFDDLPPPIEEGLYHIAQEALNNALKHAGAENVTVSINADDEAVTLAVEDDGRGFDPSSVVDRGGIGLTSMRERAERMGADLKILSAAGDGTTVCIEVARHAADIDGEVEANP